MSALPDGQADVDWSGFSRTSYDEFGSPQTLAGGGGATASPRYGWLGAAQRSAESASGTILMGVRLYAPWLGRFLTIDPVPGGSATAYDYCNADPVNCTDLDGRFPSLRSIMGGVALVADLASTFIPGPVGAAVGAVAVGAYLAVGNKEAAKMAAITAAATLVGLGAVAGGVKLARVLKTTETAGRLFARAAPKIERAAAGAKSALSSTKQFLKKNNFLRIGPVTKGTPFRVSIGAAEKHWNKFGALRQRLQPIHIHMERAKAAITLHRTKKTIRLWGNWQI